MSFPYKYSPLSSDTRTRMIELQPAKSISEPLYCTIVEADISIGLEYSAVSYTWGIPNFTENLVIDQIYSFPITPNLRDALLRFRLEYEPRRLWIDAICINQEDDIEKSKQVAFMSSIYRTAISVLVWLGDFPNAAKSLKELKALSQTAHVRFMNQKQFDTDASKHLQVLSDLPWFHRRWIIQEVVLSPEPILYCSSENLPWIRLVSVIIRLDKTPRQLRSIEAMVALWRQCLFGDETEALPRQELIRLVCRFEGFQCSNDKDKIYALAGLSKDNRTKRTKSQGRINNQEGFSSLVDYTRSTEEIYTRFAESVWCMTGHDNHLWHSICERTNANQEFLDCPWWTPDWRLPRLREHFRTSMAHYYVAEQLRILLNGRQTDYTKCPEEDDGLPFLRTGCNIIVTEVWDVLPLNATPSDTAQCLKTTINGVVKHHFKKDNHGRDIADFQDAFMVYLFHCLQYIDPQPFHNHFDKGIRNCWGADVLTPKDVSFFPILLELVKKQGDYKEETLFSSEELQLLSRVANLWGNRRAFSWSSIKESSLPHCVTTFGLGPNHLCRGDLIVDAPFSTNLFESRAQDYKFFDITSLAARQLTGTNVRFIGDCYIGLETAKGGKWEETLTGKKSWIW